MLTCENYVLSYECFLGFTETSNRRNCEMVLWILIVKNLFFVVCLMVASRKADQ